MNISTWQERRVDAPGVRLRVRELGDASGPTVVLVHGWPDASVVWDDVAERLAPDHHVVTYDVRGIGGSGQPTGDHPYALPRLADDLFAVIDGVSPDQPAHVVGHDWGSIQSWEAVTAPQRQARVASYTSISGPCLDHVGHAVRERLRSRRHLGAVLYQSLRSTYIVFLHTPVLGTGIWRFGGARAMRRFLARIEGVADDGRHPGLVADARAGVQLYRANIFQRLARPRERRTDVPVLLIELTRDHHVGSVLVESATPWVSDLTRRSIDARHWAIRTHPDEVAGLVREHISRTSVAATKEAAS